MKHREFSAYRNSNIIQHRKYFSSKTRLKPELQTRSLESERCAVVAMEAGPADDATDMHHWSLTHVVTKF